MFCCCSFLMLCIYFQATLPCHQQSTPASQTHEGLHQLWALPWLLSIAFSFSSTTSATVLSGHFLATGIFYLKLLPNIFGTFPIFWLNLLLSRFCWEPAVTFLKVAGLHTDFLKHRPSPSVCLIHSNLQSLIHLKCVFMHVNIATVLLMVKTLIRSAATLFSSHENIKQQPN